MFLVLTDQIWPAVSEYFQKFCVSLSGVLVIRHFAGFHHYKYSLEWAQSSNS